MFKRPFSRGSSVLAALVLVAALSVVVAGVQFFNKSTHASPLTLNSLSQTATAATPTPTPRPAAAGPDAATVAKCQPIKDAAANAGTGTSAPVDQSIEAKKDTTEQNRCVGAVVDEKSDVTIKLRAAGKDPKKDASAYKCVGEITTVTMDATGKGSIKSVPATDTPPEAGTCRTKFCDAAGKCSPTKDVQGGKSIQTWATDPATFASLPPEVKAAAVGLGPIPASQMGPLQAALNGDATAANTAADQKQQAVTDAQAKFDYASSNCASSDLNATESASCAAAVSQTQADLQQKQADLAAAQKTKDALAAAQEKLSPGPITPGTDQPGVVDQCAKTGGCVDPTGKVIPKTDNTFPTPTTPTPTTPNGGLGSMLSSFMSGLAKGLGSSLGAPTAPAAAPAQPCSTDPNTLAQQQQQYQTQLQQYNQQLQQAQYQQQMNSYYAQNYGTTPPPPPMMPAAPTPCTNAGTAATPAAATAPAAQLSCQPQVADVGMSVAISYACTNSTTSAGSGFGTGGAISGSTTTVIALPPAGANTVTYGLTCMNQGLTASASCPIQISRPSIVLVVNPKVVPVGEAATVGWITSGMQACVVSSPDMPDFTAANASNTSVNGMATTSPLTNPVGILLHCQTLGGGTKDASTTISVGGGSATSTGSVVTTSSIDGTNVARGATTTIQWQTTNPASGTKIALWLYDVRLAQPTALIVDGLSTNGSYAWHLPNASDACDPNAYTVCGSDLVPTRQYGIEAALYVPTSDPNQPNYIDYGYTPAPFTVTQ